MHRINSYIGICNLSFNNLVPKTAPEGIRLLLQQCWSFKPRNRPSFSQILKHLEIVVKTEPLFKSDDEYFKNQIDWKDEIKEKMKLTEMQQYNLEEDLIQKRKEELKHATYIRELYEHRLETANNIYLELSTVLLQLDSREDELIKRERTLNIKNERIVRPILRRESSNRKKSHVKRSKPVENSSKDNNISTERTNGDIQEIINSCDEITNNLNASLHNINECNFEERGIDTIHSPIIFEQKTDPITFLKKIARSKSVNSIDSRNLPSFREVGLTREDSLPPSYPTVLANKQKTGYYSEGELNFNNQHPSKIDSPKFISKANKSSNLF